jgi:hypothetical protein
LFFQFLNLPLAIPICGHLTQSPDFTLQTMSPPNHPDLLPLDRFLFPALALFFENCPRFHICVFRNLDCVAEAKTRYSAGQTLRRTARRLRIAQRCPASEADEVVIIGGHGMKASV